MNKNKKQFIFKTLIFCIALFLMNSEVFSIISANGAGNGYDDGDDGNSNCMAIKGNSLIEAFIEKGGGYFLNAFSNIMSISNRIEMANLKGIDYEELKNLVECALNNIKNAKETYYILIQIALNTPYNQEVISKLENFNYQAFITDHSLNSIIFKEVEEYLKYGNITGTFIRIRTSFIKIEELLLQINDEVSINKMPILSKVWEVNEEASNALIFGQNITRIFYALE